jgi:hypothetical protein
LARDPFEMRAGLPGSAVGFLIEAVAAELDEDGIPPGCVHLVTANWLFLPSWTLMCGDCAETAELADRQPGPCSACTIDGACASVTWFQEPGRLFVTARVCQDCGTSGNVPLCPN